MDAARTCPSCRVTRLSRYNAEPVCSACLASSHSTGATAPQWLWDSVPLRQALADAELGTALAIIRASAGLSQMELAVLLDWEQSAVARVENGTRKTLYDIRKLLAAADALGMPRRALTPLLLGDPTMTGNDAEDTVDRRQFGGTLLGLGLVAATGPDKIQVPARVGAPHVHYLRAIVDRLYRQDQQVGGAAIVYDALRHYHQARRMLDEADYSRQAGIDLTAAAGDLAVCVGWLAYDAGDHALSRHMYTDALALADEAGDDILRVRVMEKLALQCVSLARGDHVAPARRAVQFAERAADLAHDDPTPRLHALLASREAIGHAALGDRREFTAAITRAWREIGRGVATDDPVWLRFVTHQEIRVQEAKGRAYLGDQASAIALYRESLNNPNLSPRNRLNYRAQLAAALAIAGDTTAALHEGAAVLPALETRVASPRTVRELAPVRAAAEQRGYTDFCARYDKATREGQT